MSGILSGTFDPSKIERNWHGVVGCPMSMASPKSLSRSKCYFFYVRSLFLRELSNFFHFNCLFFPQFTKLILTELAQLWKITLKINTQLFLIDL